MMITIDMYRGRTHDELFAQVIREYMRLHRASSLSDLEFISRASIEVRWIGVDDPVFGKSHPVVVEQAEGVVSQTFEAYTHGQLLCEVIRIHWATYHGHICSHNWHADRQGYRNRGHRRWIPEGEEAQQLLQAAEARHDIPVAVLRSHPDTPGALPHNLEGKLISCNPAWPEMSVDAAVGKLDPACHASWSDCSPSIREESGGLSAMVVYVRPGSRRALAAVA